MQPVRCFFLTWLGLASFLAGHSVGAAEPDAAAANTAAMHALFDREYQRDLRENPLNASFGGDRRFNRLWPDQSPAAFKKSGDADAVVLTDLAKISRSALPAAEQLNYDLFAHEYRDRLMLAPFKGYLYANNHQGGVQTLNELVENLPLDTAADYDDWLARLATIGTYIDQNIENWKFAAREHRMLPKALCSRMTTQFEQQDVADPEKSPFFPTFQNYPSSIDAATQAQLTARARDTIRTSVLPAYARLHQAFLKSYLPACTASIGISETPDGTAYYAALARYHTTTDLTPDQIHEIGLKEVARIHGDMEKIIAKVGFKGTFTEFLQFLRTDPQFYYKTGDELFTAYLASDSDDERAEHDDGVLQRAVRRWAPPRLLLRQSLPAGSAAEVRNRSTHESRGGARPSPADCASDGTRRTAKIPPARGLHRVCRRVGTLFRESRRSARPLHRPLLEVRAAHV
jgi:uncharacterized protein (DUF885 family)